ncbi:MAG TPA: hypothetical protein VF905_04530 [Nitrospirota bacterium]
MEWGEAGGETKWTIRCALLAVALCLIASCSPKKEALRPLPPRMEDVQLRLAANREFVGVQFRMIGADGFNPEVTEIYLVDESTGEKFYVVRLQRIGRMAEFRVPGEKDLHHIMFRNQEGKLKIGSRVTVVVGSAHQEHLLVQP